MNTCCHEACGEGADLWTPLHWAAMLGDTRLVNFLLDKGAETGTIATGESEFISAGVTPLIVGFKVMYECHDIEYRRKYDTAAFYRLLDTATPEMINVRLSTAHGRFNESGTEAPLAAACEMLDLNLVIALLAKRADPNFPATSKQASEPGEQSPLSKAVVSHGHTCGNGESEERRVELQKENAARIEIAKALLASGADVNLCKNLLSSVEGNEPLRELLIEHGAMPSSELTQSPVTWSDDKSRAEIRMGIRSHGTLMLPSTEDLTAILQAQSLTELHLHDGNESLFQEVPGTSESVKKLSCCLDGCRPDIEDNKETALLLLSKFPLLEELTWDYAHAWINEHEIFQLARVTPNLRVLRLHGDREVTEGSGRICVSDGGVARLTAALPLQSLWVGSSSFLTSLSEPVDYKDVWEPGGYDLSPKPLEALSRQCPSLESLCLDSYEVNCSNAAKTVTIVLAPFRCLRHLALRLLLTDANVACIAKAAPNLSTLALVSPLLTDAALAAVATCSELEALSFDAHEDRYPQPRRCNVSDAGVVQLAGACPRLQTVAIHYSQKLTAASITALAKLPGLRILHLDGAREGFATAAACDSLRAGCARLEFLHLGGFRRMGADAIEALSQCRALRVLKLRGELSREDLPRICATFSSGFGALQMWSYSPPHKFNKSFLRQSGLHLSAWEQVDRDMTPEQEARARVRLQRPDIKVIGSRLGGEGLPMKYRRRSTAIAAAREAYLSAFAMQECLVDVVRGYDSDDCDDEEGCGST